MARWLGRGEGGSQSPTRRSRPWPWLAAILIAAGCAVTLNAQTVDLSGTWKLDESASTVDPAATLAGLGGHKAVPSTLYVTQARNGTLVIGSDMNTSHARNYKPGGETKAPGAAGERLMKTHWEGRTLVSESGDSAAGSSVREAFTLSGSGDALTVVVTAVDEAGTHTSRLVYAGTMVESPCKQWPTPCKDWPADQSTAGRR